MGMLKYLSADLASGLNEFVDSDLYSISWLIDLCMFSVILFCCCRRQRCVLRMRIAILMLDLHNAGSILYCMTWV